MIFAIAKSKILHDSSRGVLCFGLETDRMHIIKHLTLPKDARVNDWFKMKNKTV